MDISWKQETITWGYQRFVLMLTCIWAPSFSGPNFSFSGVIAIDLFLHLRGWELAEGKD